MTTSFEWLRYFNLDGPTRVGSLKEEISEETGYTETLVSKWLKELADEGYLSRGRYGSFHYYELTDRGKRKYSDLRERGAINRKGVRLVSSQPDYIHKDEFNRQMDKLKEDLGLPNVPKEGLIFEPHELSYAMFKHLVETSLASREMTFAVVPMGTEVKVTWREEGKRPVSRRVMKWADIKGDPVEKDREIRRLKSIIRDAGLGDL